MAMHVEERFQRGLRYAIVDEVDSILIDEARTPLIISGQAEDRTELYHRMNEVPPLLDAAEGGEEAGPARAAGRLLRRREEPPDRAVRGRPPEGRGDPGAHRPAAAGRQPVRAGLHQPGAPPVRRAARAPPVPPRPALRGAGRRGDHRRRVHRAPDAGPALVGRPAPGGGGEGEGGDPEREPDARLDHLPELLPHVRQARRHDRHRRHRGLRVPADLRPGDGGDPDQRADDPRRPARPGVPHRQGEVPGGDQGHPGLPGARPAGAGRHHLDRELGAALGPAGEGKARAPGAQRQAARARGRDRGAGRPAEDDHHRHQHGRPRHRHRARRQRREAGATSSTPTRRSPRRRRSRASTSCAPSGSRCTTRW